MTQEEKELLLKDLSARLPYGVHIREYNAEYGWHDGVLSTITNDYFSEGEPSIEGNWINCVENVRPYLRPLSSMTEDEKNYLEEELCTMYNGDVNTDYETFGIEILDTHPKYGDSFSQDFTALDWLNAHHFDYRGLIPMGLGIDCTGLNIYENEESI